MSNATKERCRQKRILAKTGIDAKGIILDSSGVSHAINKRHHHLVKEDFQKVAKVVNESSDIELESSMHRANHTIMFKESGDNGLNLCMEFRQKKGNLALVTMYYQREVSHGNDGRAPEQTSETTRDNASIPQSTKKSSLLFTHLTKSQLQKLQFLRLRLM